jgi:hypothetical protein
MISRLMKNLLWLPFWILKVAFSILFFFIRRFFLENTDEDAKRRLFKKSDRDEILSRHYVGKGYYRCPRCKQKKRKRDMHIDHIIPYSKGGATSLKNGQALCGPCNMSKGSSHSVMEALRGERRRC